jgi:hypothetical protein
MPEKILVSARMDRMGNIIIRPVSDKWARRFARAVKSNGGGYHKDIFFQEGMGAEEFIGQDLPARYKRDIENGWIVRFLVDPWLVGMWYGYDACNVA